MNRTLVSIGEKIHDALYRFAILSSKRNWIWHNLEGGCAVGSYFLVKEAEKFGIPAIFMVGGDHCWVESENFIYDVTATQFTVMGSDIIQQIEQATKVRVMSFSEIDRLPPHTFDLPREQWGSGTYTCNSVYDTTKDNLRYINRTWPQGQRIRGYHIEWFGKDARIFWRGKSKTIG